MAVVICSIRVPPPLRCWPRFYTDFHWPGFFTGKPPLKDRIITRNAKSSNFSSSTSTILACPICYKPLMSRTDPELSSASTSGSGVECYSCKRLYPHNEIYYDLTIASGLKDYSEPMTVATELFRNPLVSFLYERGWRQNFIWGGFPGPEREFKMALDYLKPTSGVALDFSESMLQQCHEYNKQENLSKEDFVMVRADISRLPFVANSIDAVHAGAALHCWPSPSTGVAEISRVLRPGGIFVASTFILDVFPPAVPVFEATREYFIRFTGNHLYLSEYELEDLCRSCGLVGFTCMRNGAFVMFSAAKPNN
ncbi:hypothetical protein HPP92_004292 [Vanilla planifolia]|uniref:Methyltransferase type 11 domain-containing protein n=1 Tax=Vanilla planifolia TaxID=51239 RepID=A0A835VK73_VANPL|nr:hypothetical protein HPP92_004292 [Vanilla planifolia]